MKQAYIALGTNIGERVENLNMALKKLESTNDIEVVKQSSIYETAPVGFLDQADFLNMVIQVQTPLSAIKLLDHCQEIEQNLGRERTIRFGPRTIDLDILLYNQENSDTERLSIPHPRMHERAFVLIPLHEIAPDVMIPVINKDITTSLKELSEEEKQEVVKWDGQIE